MSDDVKAGPEQRYNIIELFKLEGVAPEQILTCLSLGYLLKRILVENRKVAMTCGPKVYKESVMSSFMALERKLIPGMEQPLSKEHCDALIAFFNQREIMRNFINLD